MRIGQGDDGNGAIDECGAVDADVDLEA